MTADSGSTCLLATTSSPGTARKSLSTAPKYSATPHTPSTSRRTRRRATSRSPVTSYRNGPPCVSGRATYEPPPGRLADSSGHSCTVGPSGRPLRSTAEKHVELRLDRGGVQNVFDAVQLAGVAGVRLLHLVLVAPALAAVLQPDPRHVARALDPEYRLQQRHHVHTARGDAEELPGHQPFGQCVGIALPLGLR